MLLIVGSCSKDSVTPTKMAAKIDGKSWSAAFTANTLASDVIVITGTSALSGIFAITIHGTTASTYELGIGKLECTATYKASTLSTDLDIYESTAGKVVLTKIDRVNKKISGTFQFTMFKPIADIISVSNGTFNDITFTEL